MSGEAAEILVNNGFTKVYNAEGVKNHSYELTTYGNIRGAELMEKAKDALVVDAREAKDFAKEHFATAVNVNSEDPKTIDAILPDDKNTLIITHCYSGNRSAKAAEYIASKGYTNVWNCLDGTKEITYDFSKGDK
jgi:rhodanese family domain protein